VFSHAAGALAVIDASLVNVTVSVPFAAMIRALESACALPDVPVAKFHTTSLVDVEHPDWAVARLDVVKPPA
jgi:hypothetical protein